MNIKHVLRSNSIVQCVVLVHNVCTSVCVSFREMPVMVYEYARTTPVKGLNYVESTARSELLK